MTSLYSSPTTCDPSTLLSSPSTSSLKSTSVTPNSNKKRRLSTPDSSATSFSLDRSSPGESSNGQRGAMDPERAARLAARAARNRISAQNSRDRKKQHVGQLEEEVNQLRHDKAELAQRVKTLEGLVYSLLSSQQSSCTSLPSSSSVPLSTATPSTELQADLPITSVASNSQSRAEGHIVPVAAPTTPTVSDSASSTLRTSGLAHDSSKAADHARLPAAETTSSFAESDDAPQRAWKSQPFHIAHSQSSTRRAKKSALKLQRQSMAAAPKSKSTTRSLRRIVKVTKLPKSSSQMDSMMSADRKRLSRATMAAGWTTSWRTSQTTRQTFLPTSKRLRHIRIILRTRKANGRLKF